MERITDFQDYQKSQIIFLPFINLPPSSPDCINSVTNFAVEKCKKIHKKCCFVTFDQPLYSKARKIIESTNMIEPKVVVRLGSFHLLMSFMGAIGYIMAGSGLKELLRTIYPANSIAKIMTGHAYSRAVRAHFLTQLCLGKIILDELDLLETKKTTLKYYILSKNCINITLEEIKNEEILQDVMSIVECYIKIMNTRGKTVTLWVQYFFLVHLLHRFIYAERSGNWYAHNVLKK